MTRGPVVTGGADTRCAQRWFVGVTTAPTWRAVQVGRSVRPVVVGWPPTVRFVGRFVTERGESWPPATRTGLARRRGVVSGWEWFTVLTGRARLELGDLVLVVEAGEAAEFSTMVPHRIGAVAESGDLEILSIFQPRRGTGAPARRVTEPLQVRQ
jgi:cupin domain